MKYAIVLGMMSFALFVGSGLFSMVGWLLIWAGVSFGLVALGYAGIGPRVFGKSSSGRISLAWKLLNLPYLAMTWLVWHVGRLLSREEAFNAIDANLVIGRRLLASEAPDGFDHYVDLTAEFEEPEPIRIRPGYRCLPILDATVPAVEELREAVESSVNGRVFVHCAQGHGRTGLFAVALLLRRGRVQTVEEGIGLLRSLRPAVRLNRVQLDFARRCLETNAERFAPKDL